MTLLSSEFCYPALSSDPVDDTAVKRLSTAFLKFFFFFLTVCLYTVVNLLPQIQKRSGFCVSDSRLLEQFSPSILKCSDSGSLLYKLSCHYWPFASYSHFCSCLASTSLAHVKPIFVRDFLLTLFATIPDFFVFLIIIYIS